MAGPSAPRVTYLEDDNRHERFRVTSKLAVHSAGKINAADQVLSERTSDSTQKNMSSAKFDDLRGRDGVPPGHKEKIRAWLCRGIRTWVSVKDYLMAPFGGEDGSPLAK